MAATDQKLQILLELERRGELNAQEADMLSRYRAQGTSKTKAIDAAGNAAGGNEQYETPKDRDQARAALDLIGRMQPILDQTSSLYDRDLKGSGIVKSAMEYLPSQENSRFDTASSMLKALARQNMRTPGEGAMSDFESKLALMPMPDRWKFDQGNEEALGNLQKFLDESRQMYAKRAGITLPDRAGGEGIATPEPPLEVNITDDSPPDYATQKGLPTPPPNTAKKPGGPNDDADGGWGGARPEGVLIDINGNIIP